MQKSHYPKKSDIEPNWFFVDAGGKILGKVASEVSDLLRGKKTATYTPGVFSGNHVVVTNAAKVETSGNKLKNKVYFRHSDYPGGLKQETLGQLMEKDPTKAIERAVKGMLPTNKLTKKYMANLHIYVDDKHPHEAQKGKK